MNFKIIAVDFDGTLCENKWPEIGEPNLELIAYLKERQAAGDKLILWTCRRDEILQNAVVWAAKHGIIFDAVNANLPEVLEWMGGDSRKIFADVYIDDKNCSLHDYKGLGLTPEQLQEVDREYLVLAKEVMELRKEKRTIEQ